MKYFLLSILSNTIIIIDIGNVLFSRTKKTDDKVIDHVDEFLKLMSVLTGDKKYEEIGRAFEVQEKKEGISMKADNLRKLSMVVNIMYIVVALAEIVILVADMKNTNNEEVQ